VRLSNIEISGFKSIEHLSLEVGRINVLIGANGPENRISCCSSECLLRWPPGDAVFCRDLGGADGCCITGRK